MLWKAASMTSDLKELVHTSFQTFKAYPEKAQTRFYSTVSLKQNTHCVARMRHHELDIDEPSYLGGTDQGSNPVELLLSSIAACRIITYQFHAARLGIDIERLDIEMEGDLDLRGLLGVNETTRPGFGSVACKVFLYSDAHPDLVKALMDVVAAHCPVSDSVQNITPMTVSCVHRPAQAEDEG